MNENREKTPQNEIDRLKNLFKIWCNAIRNKDLDIIMKMITDDAVFLTSNTPPLKGKSAVKELYVKLFATYNVIQEWTCEEVKIEGNVAITWGSDQLELTHIDHSRSLKLKGYAMSVFQRQQNGEWKIIRGITNMTPDN